MWEKLIKGSRNISTAVFVFLVSALIILAFFRLAYPRYLSLHRSLEERTNLLVQSRKQVLSFDGLAQENRLLKEQLTAEGVRWEREIRTGGNFYYIGRFAAENHLTVIYCQPQSILDMGEYYKVPARICVRGQYQDMISFIQSLESDMPDSTEIVTIELQSENKDPEQNNGSPKKPEEKSESKSESDLTKEPDLTLICDITTYLINSPGQLNLTGAWALGQGSAFSPTVDIVQNTDPVPDIKSISSDKRVPSIGQTEYPFAAEEIDSRVSEEVWDWPQQEGGNRQINYHFPEKKN